MNLVEGGQSNDMTNKVTQLRRHVHGSSFHYKDFLISNGGYDGSFEDPHGFILYKQVTEAEMVIGELYVEPSKRQIGIATELVDRVKDLAIAKGCTILSCKVSLNGVNDYLGMVSAIHYGFRPIQAHNDQIIYIMPLGGQ